MLLKGLSKVRAEMGLTFLVYNIKRAINIVGVEALIAAVRKGDYGVGGNQNHFVPGASSLGQIG